MYRPREPHPLLQKADAVSTITAKEEDAPTVAISDDHSEHSDAVPVAEDDIERLLFHSRFHCDTVDALDLPSASQQGRRHRGAAGLAVR